MLLQALEDVYGFYKRSFFRVQSLWLRDSVIRFQALGLRRQESNGLDLRVRSKLEEEVLWYANTTEAFEELVYMLAFMA